MDSNNVFANFLADAQHLILDGGNSCRPQTSKPSERVVVYQADYDIAALISRLQSCKVLYVAVQGRYLLDGSGAMSAPKNLSQCVNIITLLAPDIDDRAHAINIHAMFKNEQRRPLDKLFKEQGKTSLRNLFEDAKLPKVFWDCSLGLSALREVFGKWNVRGLVDLQLVEWLRRVRFSAAGSKPLRARSLVDCLDSSVGFCSYSAAPMLATKLTAESRCLKGYMAVMDLEDRKETLEYCLDQVQYLPALHRKFSAMLRGPGPRENLD